jgi:hypothetical protein
MDKQDTSGHNIGRGSRGANRGLAIVMAHGVGDIATGPARRQAKKAGQWVQWGLGAGALRLGGGSIK